VKAEAKELKKVDFIELKPTREMLPDHLKKPIWQLSLKELEEFRSFMKYAIGWVERELKHRAKGDMKKFEAILREYADIETPKKKKYSESWISKNLEKMAYEV
jgi:hypothetical protein